jgi:ribosomal protein L28
MAKRPGKVGKSKRSRSRAPVQLSLFDLLEAPNMSADLPAAAAKSPAKPRTRRATKPAVDKPAVLTPAEAATYLNVKTATLKSWRAKGVGPAFVKRAARLIGYTPAALEAYLAQVTPRKA